MRTIRQLDVAQLDGLREIVNIGSAHAATALSQITDRRVMITAPRLQVALLDAVVEPGTDQQVVAVVTRIVGEVTGHTGWLMDGATAVRIAHSLVGRSAHPDAALDELGESSLKETGNILSGAYLSAVAEITGRTPLNAAPRLVVDRQNNVLKSLVLESHPDSDLAVWIETDFQFDDDASYRADFVLVPDMPSMIEEILDAVGLS